MAAPDSTAQDDRGLQGDEDQEGHHRHVQQHPLVLKLVPGKYIGGYIDICRFILPYSGPVSPPYLGSISGEVILVVLVVAAVVVVALVWAV